LGECNTHGVAVSDFEQTFCYRCKQPECARSSFGKDRFDQRVANWQDRLFTNVPRMNESDPRYAPIAGKRFLTIDTGPIPEVRTQSAWLDPREIKEPEPAPVAASPAPIAAKPPEAPPATAAPVVASKSARRLAPMNTPHQSGGVMLPGAPSPTPKPTTEAWDGPRQPPAPTDPVVKPGSKVKLGGGGV